MLLHPDFLLRATVMAAEPRWVGSPEPGIDRVMADRLGAERARAPSLVQYASTLVFLLHVHLTGLAR
jgi:anti-sigma factor ChrR (cupin superfamily)